MPRSTTNSDADATIDRAETLRFRLDGDEPVTADEVADLLVEAGPEEARTIIPRAQAETLALRDLLGVSRKETAERLDLSPYTVDDRLRRGRDNAEAAAIVARALSELGLVDDEVLGGVATLDEFEEADDASPEEPGSEDATPGPWSRIMSVDAVAQVTPGEEGGVTTVKLVDSSIEEEEEVEAALEDLGLDVIARTGGSDVFKIRARRPGEDGDEDASGDEPPKREERAILLLDGTPVPEETEGLPEPLLAEIADTVETTLARDLGDVRDGNTLGTLVLDGETWSFNPAPRYPTTDEVATHRDDDETDEDAEDGAQGDDEDEEAEEPSDEEDGDEEAHTCVCGASFGSPQALGGHTNTCEEAQAARDADEEDEATEETSDTDETADEAHTCVCGYVAESSQALGGHTRHCDEAQADRDAAAE